MVVYEIENIITNNLEVSIRKIGLTHATVPLSYIMRLSVKGMNVFTVWNALDSLRSVYKILSGFSINSTDWLSQKDRMNHKKFTQAEISDKLAESRVAET